MLWTWDGHWGLLDVLVDIAEVPTEANKRLSCLRSYYKSGCNVGLRRDEEILQQALILKAGVVQQRWSDWAGFNEYFLRKGVLDSHADRGYGEALPFMGSEDIKGERRAQGLQNGRTGGGHVGVNMRSYQGEVLQTRLCYGDLHEAKSEITEEERGRSLILFRGWLSKGGPRVKGGERVWVIERGWPYWSTG
jgi:hypothetical protein